MSPRGSEPLRPVDEAGRGRVRLLPGSHLPCPHTPRQGGSSRCRLLQGAAPVLARDPASKPALGFRQGKAKKRSPHPRRNEDSRMQQSRPKNSAAEPPPTVKLSRSPDPTPRRSRPKRCEASPTAKRPQAMRSKPHGEARPQAMRREPHGEAAQAMRSEPHDRVGRVKRSAGARRARRGEEGVLTYAARAETAARRAPAPVSCARHPHSLYPQT